MIIHALRYVWLTCVLCRPHGCSSVSMMLYRRSGKIGKAEVEAEEVVRRRRWKAKNCTERIGEME